MATTQLLPCGLPGQPYGEFAGKEAGNPGGPKSSDRLTQLLPCGLPGRLYSSFVGKEALAPTPVITPGTSVGGGGGRYIPSHGNPPDTRLARTHYHYARIVTRPARVRPPDPNAPQPRRYTVRGRVALRPAAVISTAFAVYVPACLVMLQRAEVHATVARIRSFRSDLAARAKARHAHHEDTLLLASDASDEARLLFGDL